MYSRIFLSSRETSLSMFFKCFLRQCFLRRQAYLLNIVLVILFLCIYFHKTSFLLIPSISNETLMSNGSCQPERFDRSRLNCSGEPAKQWCDNEVNVCQSALIIYQNLFAITHSVILKPSLAKGKRLGGENIEEVLNQPESNEYFQFEKDFLQVKLASRVFSRQRSIFSFCSFHAIAKYPLTYLVTAI